MPIYWISVSIHTSVSRASWTPVDGDVLRTPQKISHVRGQNPQTSVGENEDRTPRVLSKGLPKRKEPNTIRLMLTCI